MLHILERITTEYSNREDRIRVIGELTDGRKVVLWLTRSLLRGLVPHFCRMLTDVAPKDDAAQREVMRIFAQETARAEYAADFSVKRRTADMNWLVATVEIAARDGVIALAFKGRTGRQAILPLTVLSLRQWIYVLHDQCRMGKWALDVWPVWVRPEGWASRPRQAASLLIRVRRFQILLRRRRGI